MHFAPRSIRGLIGLALAAVLSLPMLGRAEEVHTATIRQPVAAAGAVLPSLKPAAAKKRHKSTVRRPLELTLPRLTFSSAAPSAASQSLPPPVLLEPYEPARFHRFGPSPFRQVTALRTDPLKDEPFRIGFSPDWDLQWDLLQDTTPASGHRFGLNIGLQRKF